MNIIYAMHSYVHSKQPIEFTFIVWLLRSELVIDFMKKIFWENYYDQIQDFYDNPAQSSVSCLFSR